MKKNTFMISISFIFLLLICGCASDEDKAKEILYTAQLEIQQFAEVRAGKLFERIVKNYPKTESAKIATEELKKLREKVKTKQ